MEIVIKTKQKLNPYFSFLIPEDQLYHYYQWMLQAISTGKYPGEGTNSKVGAGDDHQLPVSREVDGETKKGAGTSKTSHGGVGVVQKAEEEEDSESDDESDDEGFELHPLLRASLTRKKPANAPPVTCEQKDTPTSSFNSFVSPVSSKAFRHIALSMNSTSALVPATRSSGGQPHALGLATISCFATFMQVIMLYPTIRHPGTTAQAALPVPTSNNTVYLPPHPVAHSGPTPVYPGWFLVH